ncbi:hypothetical protein SH2C18_36160 [Clostridium sediminicola]|uniref:hypothetical protein n=1 Tax=Clostridium sediminicola TaxID=3114879 RepID=UPI0031F270FB
MKASLAKLIMSKYNLLILDEPTNYLDMSSLKVLEEVLYEYEGTLILVTHERRFLSKVATSLLIFDNLELRIFQGGYNEYLKSLDDEKITKTKDKKSKERLMVIESNINRIMGMISTIFFINFKLL